MAETIKINTKQDPDPGAAALDERIEEEKGQEALAKNSTPGRRWRLWFFIVFCPALALVYMNRKVFPESWPVLAFLLFVTVGVSHWISSWRDTGDPAIDAKSKFMEYAFSITLFCNLAYHSFFARGVENREKALIESEKIDTHKSEMSDAESKRKTAEAAAQKALAEAQAKASQAAANAASWQIRARNSNRFVSGRRNYPGAMPLVEQAAPAASPVPAASRPTIAQVTGKPLPLPSLKPQAAQAAIVPTAAEPAAEPVETAGAFRTRHEFPLWIFAMIETFFAVCGGAYFMGQIKKDADGNGRADWVDRLIASGKETAASVRAKYGDKWAETKDGYSQVVRGQRPAGKVTPGGSQAIEIPDGMTDKQAEEFLDKNYPNMPKGSRIHYEKTLFESDGVGWHPQGVFAVDDSPSPLPRPALRNAALREKSAGASFDATAEKRPPARPETAGAAVPKKASASGQLKTAGKSSEKAKKQGNNWILLGVTLPDVSGIRYESQKDRGSVEIQSGGRYLANIGKRDLAKLAAQSEGERFQAVRDKIAAAQAKKSENEFEKQGGE